MMPRKKTAPRPQELLQALSERIRLRLLNLMRDRELCVCYFIAALDAPQPTISRHLAYLRHTGLVAARREGYWMHYRITPPAEPSAAKVLSEVMAWVANDPEMRRDRMRLERACCAPEKFVLIHNAPPPTPITDPPLHDPAAGSR